jgi:hypothetical protein
MNTRLGNQTDPSPSGQGTDPRGLPLRLLPRVGVGRPRRGKGRGRGPCPARAGSHPHPHTRMQLHQLFVPGAGQPHKVRHHQPERRHRGHLDVGSGTATSYRLPGGISERVAGVDEIGSTRRVRHPEPGELERCAHPERLEHPR